MTLEGVDYSSGRLSSQTLRDNGLAFVCRYVSNPGNGKNLTQPEIADWAAHGIGIVVVFEQGQRNALEGAGRGAADARLAQSQLDTLRIPGAPMYFAVDFEASSSQMATVAEYLRAAAGIVGLDRAGVYGSYSVVRNALDQGLVRYAWQTYAWSHGHLDERAHIYQYHNDVRISGVEVDRDRTVGSDTDYGQVDAGSLDAGSQAEVPQETDDLRSSASQEPTLRRGSRGPHVLRLQRALGVDPDGVFGSVTEAAVTEFQAAGDLDVDGVVGRRTWQRLNASVQ